MSLRKSFCLDSVSSFKEINSSPHNRSSSKQLYSFSKDSRFKRPKVYCDSFYEKPSSFRVSGAGIGYGSKSDFTRDLTASPGSSKYRLDTIFDKNRKSSRGAGFARYPSREQEKTQQIPSQSYIPSGPLKVPGPNKYQNMKLNKGLSYTSRMRTRTIDKTMSIDAQNENPGPGNYEDPEKLSPRGKYSVSKHKGSGTTIFSPRRSVRFFQFKNDIPGPGKYNEINAMSDRGNYPLSQTNGFGKRYFDKEKRVVEFQKMARTNFNPGSGSYRMPSDFGQYDGNVYRRSQVGARNRSNSKKYL